MQYELCLIICFSNALLIPAYSIACSFRKIESNQRCNGTIFQYNSEVFLPNVIVTLQTVQLRNWFHAGTADTLADIPNLDATFTSGVNVLGRIRDRDGADHLAVSQGINLTRVTRNARSD